MIYSILAISEFATKLVAGLSGVVFAALILGLAIGSKNKKSKNINPEKLRQKANETPIEEKSSKKSKKSKADKSDKDAQTNSADAAQAAEQSDENKDSK